MEEKTVKLPPKPVKNEQRNPSGASTSYSNQPEYINVQTEFAPSKRPSNATKSPPMMLPKKIEGLNSKHPKSSEDTEKQQYINIQTPSKINTLNALPVSPKKNIPSASITSHEYINVHTPPVSRSSPSAPNLEPKKKITTSPTSIECKNEYINTQKTISPKPYSSNVSTAKASTKSSVTNIQPEYMNVKLQK